MRDTPFQVVDGPLGLPRPARQAVSKMQFDTGLFSDVDPDLPDAATMRAPETDPAEAYEAILQKAEDELGRPDVEDVDEGVFMWEGDPPFLYHHMEGMMHVHDFPTPHYDALASAIPYDVPDSKVDELAEFDGSVYYHKTPGHLIAECHTLAANRLALNLAIDIVEGNMSVSEAREFYTETIEDDMERGEARFRPRYMRRIVHDVPMGGTGDKGVVTVENPP